MRNNTRLAFNGLLSHLATLNGINADDIDKHFAVTPSVAQALYEKVQLSSDFLSRINVITVPAQEGQKVGVAITRPIAGRTDTTGGAERNPGNPTDTSARGYRCEKTDYDTPLLYSLLDMWGHRPEFQTLVRDVIAKRQGLDKIMIGWNGTSVAATTDRNANPLLQDVNKGWIQNVREQAPAQIMSHGTLDGAKIYVSPTADAAHRDYVNLDALVYDLVELLGETYREDTELVAICGRGLVHDKYFGVINRSGDQATEQLARDVLLSTKKIGGLPAVRVPFFPPQKVVVTRLDNLSVYDQEGTERRMIQEQPQRNRVVDFQSVNEAFVVEDNDLFAMAENIQLAPKA